MDKEYKISAKRADTGKWWTYGSIKKNKFDNLQAGFKVTPELKALIDANEGKWINFSLFEESEKRDTPPEAKQGINKLNATAGALLDDSIPFSPRYWF
jgi:hypothetical protein